jgi:hypothetical protein
MTTARLAPMTGPMSGRNLLGEVTESLHRFLLDGYNITEQPPRMEEDLKFTPKDREEVVYIYMYRLAQNPNLQNRKQYRQAPISTGAGEGEEGSEVFYHRPPLLLDLFYLLGVHSKFRSDAERLLGWVILRLNEATHLIYRPRKFILPDGREVDSLGRPYDPNASTDHPDLWMEKVSLAMVDDLTVGDAINLYSLAEAPYRPFLTYRARVALDGPLVASSGGTSIRLPGLESALPPVPRDPRSSPSGRFRTSTPLPPPTQKAPPGPQASSLRRKIDPEPDSED